MNSELQGKFIFLWEKYFSNEELPITFFYSESHHGSTIVPSKKGTHNCVIEEIQKVRQGFSLAFNDDSLACGGAKRYLGYSDKMDKNFRFFLSCGIPGELEGERYKRNPEIVDEIQKDFVNLEKSDKFIIFKRWDKLTEEDNPDAVIFFCSPDVMSGLFTLTNYDMVNPQQAVAPFGSGCATIINYPYLEQQKDDPKCIIGMFDPSARPHIGRFELAYTIPMKRFEKIIDYMDESFLITKTWDTIKKRIESKF